MYRNTWSEVSGVILDFVGTLKDEVYLEEVGKSGRLEIYRPLQFHLSLSASYC